MNKTVLVIIYFTDVNKDGQLQWKDFELARQVSLPKLKTFLSRLIKDNRFRNIVLIIDSRPTVCDIRIKDRENIIMI